MNEAPNEGERNRFLLTNLAILFVFILALVVLLVAYPIFFAPEAAPVGVASPSRLISRTPTSTTTLTPTITQTPTNTRTPRATFTPTVITVVPSETPTPGDTPTPAGPPTLTPARPVIGNENYRLNRWSDDNANLMVEYMETYPDTLPRQSRGEADRNYYAAYQYAVLAESEALLRYPDAPQADTWSWRRAYNLVRMGDPDAGDAYGELITRALNTSEVDPADLRLWFSAKEPRLHLTASKLAEVPGYLNGYLLEIAGNTVDDRNANGSAFLLLLETPGAFQHQTLASSLSLIQSRQYDAATGDLTGDGIDEVVLFQTDPGETYPLQLPQVFSLASIPAQRLPFNPAQANFRFGMEYANRWAIETANESPGTLRLETQIFPACPVSIQRNLRWDGTFFNLQETAFRVEPSPVTLSFCRALSEHAITVWGPQAAIQIMEPILPMWPPETQEDGKPFPLDAKDEWRFRLGVYHALAGNPQEAERYLNDLVAQPVIVGSRWVEPAQKFLETYQSGGLYRACVETEICNPRQALQAVVRSFSPDDYSQALTLLRQAGVDLRVSGYFDFDGDEATESWFTVRHRPSDKLEFWILAPESEGIEPMYVGVIESNQPRLEYYDTVERLPEDQKLPVVLLEGGDFAFTIDRDPDKGEAFLTPVELPRLYPDRFNQGVEAAREALFSGEDPEIVQQALLDLQEFPGLLCKGTWSCDRYYYLLGLASELSGDIPAAIDSYLRLWWDYSRSPYTAMARLKLKGTAVQPSATPTRTPLATPGASPTPTVTGTLPTLTPTVTGTPPTATPSPTGGTSTATPSLTPTIATPYQNP